MPNRWIKEAYCTSSRINQASPDARDMWVRLLVNADDHGFFHGNAQLVASACFPLQPNAEKCEQLLSELASVQLILRYESGGKHYLVLTQWYERPRSKRKFPEPPADIRKQLLAPENICEHLHVSTSTSTTTTTGSASNVTFDAEAREWRGIGSDDVTHWSEAYPALSIPAELKKAAAWLVANPKNRKSNYPKFLVGWFSRAQDKAPRLQVVQAKGLAL